MHQEDISSLIVSPSAIVISMIVLTILLVYIQFSSNSIVVEKERAYYKWNGYFKLFFSFIFSFYYIFILKGGDTYAYWQCSDALQNLLFNDFGVFWDVVTSSPTMESYFGSFNHRTGYPPRFIYMEEESFSVAKIVLFFKLITFNNYLATTFIFALFSATATWKIYVLAKRTAIFEPGLLALFVLFLPSVAFWCSGISKDTIIFVSILFCIEKLYRLIKDDNTVQKKIFLIIGFVFFAAIIYKIRPFILYALTVPLILMYVSGIINRIRTFAILRFFIKGALFACVLVGFIVVLVRLSGEDLARSSQSFSDAIVVQQDFQNNVEVYGGDDGKRYSIGDGDYSSVGLIKVLPEALIAGVYRPFFWEAFRPSLFFNGLESLLLIFMTIRFFMVHFRARFQAIQMSELLTFSIGFVLVIAFMAGFTSILFGVLVRIRAPLLPFFGMLMAIDAKQFINRENKQLELENESES